MLFQVLLELLVGCAAAQRDEHSDRFAFDIVRPTDCGSLRDARMADKRRFDLDRAQSMAADLDHVVDAAHDPVIAVIVLPGVVTRQVVTLELRPILLLVSLVVAPNAAEHAGPRPADAEHPAVVPL